MGGGTVTVRVGTRRDETARLRVVPALGSLQAIAIDLFATSTSRVIEIEVGVVVASAMRWNAWKEGDLVGMWLKGGH
jgi:hypothetical protein